MNRKIKLNFSLTKWNSTGPLGSKAIDENNWQKHWAKLDDGTGRFVVLLLLLLRFSY